MSYLYRLYLFIVIKRLSPIRGESSRNFRDGDILESLSEIGKDNARSELMSRDDIPRRGSSPGDKRSPEDSTDFFHDVSALFHLLRDERLRGASSKYPRNGDSGTVALVPIVSAIKSIFLIGVLAVKLFLLKSLALAKASLVISVLLVLNSLHNRSQDLLPSKQYPQNEPDFSGYGYTSPSHERIVSDAMNLTLMSRPEHKRKIILEPPPQPN